MNATITLNDIAGYEDEKKEAIKIVNVLRNFEKLSQEGICVPKGIILSGKPGVGKTLMAKAIAGEANVPLFELDGEESENQSGTIKDIKKIFLKAKEQIPSIILIDELDELVAKEDFYASDYSRKVLKTLLTEIDGVNSSNGVLVIATTNHVDRLPDSLLRSGRIDKNIEIQMPDFKAREAILNLYLSKHEKLASVSSSYLARKTTGLSCADIKNLINEALINNIDKETICNKDVDKLIPYIQFKGIERTQPKEIEDIIVYHELGHFITGYVLKGEIGSISLEPVSYVKGYVVFESGRESKVEIMTKSKCLKDVTISLGGYAAEKYFTGETTTGCMQDMHQALSTLELMLQSGVLGLEFVDNKVDVATSKRATIAQVGKPEITMSRIDMRNKVFYECMDNATKIISENIKLIEFLKKSLKESRKLDSDEIKELIKEFQSKN